MKTQNRFFGKLIILTFLVLGLACSKDDPDGTDPGTDPRAEANTFDEVIALGADFESFPQSKNEEVLLEEEPKNEDYEREEEGESIKERFVCTKKTVSITDGNDEFPLFNPNSGIIFPGNILQGKTLDDATPESIPLKRGKGTISYNIIDGNLQSSFDVDEVKLSSIRDAQNNIIFGSLADGDYKVPANFNLTVEEVQSKEELALKLGVKFKTFNAKVSGSFSVDTSREVNTVLVKLTQQFYTMDFDVPTSSEEFFDESVTAEALKEYIQPDNPAAFISSVTYGRTFYMLFESTSSSQEMKTKLEVGYRTIGAAGEGSVEFESFNSLKNLSLQVIAYGGDSSETLDAVGNFRDNNSIGEFLAKIGKSSDIRTGLPLSYIANSVERRSQIVGAKLATEYDIVECELKGVLPPNGYLPLVDLFEDGVGAAAHISGANAVIYNKAGTQYAWFNANIPAVLGVFDIKDENGPLGVSSFDSVGAAVNTTDGKIHVYNATGLSAEIYTYNNCSCDENTLPPGGPIGSYSLDDDGNNRVFPVNTLFGDSSNGFPFAGIGFEAASRYFTNRDSDGANIVHFFGNPGDVYAGYTADEWGSPADINIWGDKSQTHFERIGAACRILIGTNNVRQLFFNEDGTEFTIWNPSAQDPEKEFSAPWVIN